MDKDIQLINEVKNHNDDAFKELLDVYRNMIYKVINSFRLEQGDYMIDVDSLFQEGSILLYNLCFSYEVDRGVKFSTYFYGVLKLRLSTYIRKNCSYEKNCFTSIDNVENIDYQISMRNLCVKEDPISYHHELEFEKYIGEFICNLNDIDRKIISLRSADYSYKDIAKKLNISTKSVDNRLRLLKKKLREYLKNEE